MAMRIGSKLQEYYAKAITEGITLVGSSTLAIYTGSSPGSGFPTGTLLAEIPLPEPACSYSGNVITFANPSPSNGVATGTAGWFRIRVGEEYAMLTGTVTSVGGNGDLELSNLSIVSGQPVDLTGGTITIPAS